MPRAGKKSANQHNSRHENGVVAPGKRVTKQKSNGHLNGTAEGKSRANTPPASTPTSAHHTTTNGHANGPAIAHTRSVGSRLENARGLAVEVFGEATAPTAESAYSDKMGDHNNRKTDATMSRTPTAHEPGTTPLALTVLKNSPRFDTLAILMVLMSFPPAMLTVTNFAFAILTFVPPSGSFTTIPTLSDITSSFSPGTPSFIVTCLFDCIAMALWIWLPYGWQAWALETAQAMVATTLGGGYNHRPGANDNTLLTMAIVTFTHLGWLWRKIYGLLCQTGLGQFIPRVKNYDPLWYLKRFPVGSERTWFSTIKVMIALHIVVQGITRMVRRLIYNSRHSNAPTPMSTARPPDQDSSLGYSTGSELPEHAHNTPLSPTELKSRSSIQNMKEVRDKVSSGKRRRKQANYVKSQQPFWAALAATKATVMREYEVSRANADAISSKATDTENYGNAPFAASENRVWITAVGETSFSFETSYLAAPAAAAAAATKKGDGWTDGSAEASQLSPLYVRCNGMDWSSVRLEQIPGTQDECKRSQWAGEVSVLSPGKTYQVSFHRGEDNVVIHSETIATLSPPRNDHSSSPTPTTTTTFQPIRPASPASPIATLENSIASFESKLSENTFKLRRDKKDDKAALKSLRAEITALSAKLADNSDKDDKARVRQVQQAQQARQADESVLGLTQELETYAAIPKEITKELKARKSALETARNEQASAREELKRTQDSNRQELTTLEGQEMNARHRTVRTKARLEKVSQQHKRLTSPTEPSDNSRSNSSHSSAKLSDQRIAMEAEYRRGIDKLIQSFKVNSQQYYIFNSQIQALESSMAQAAESYASEGQYLQQDESRPITPEGDLPGTNPANSSNGHGRFNGYGTPDSHAATLANGHALHGNAFSRSNSSRMRSTSGFSARDGTLLDFDDDDDLVPAKVKRRSGIDNVRENSDGSGSVNGSPHVRYRGKSSPHPSPRNV